MSPIKDSRKCNECGQYVMFDMIHNIDGLNYCDVCKEKLFTECDECGCEVLKEEIKEADNNTYCEDCFHEIYYTCGDCGELVHNEEIYVPEDGDGVYCENCYTDNYTRCNDCECELHNDNALHGDGDVYCENCFYDHYTTCNECGETIHLDNTCFSENDECDYCSYCFERNESNNRNVHNYSYRPSSFDFYGKNKDGLYYGLELEVENKQGINIDDTIEAIKASNNDFMYFKEDGSINNGFEMVTHPASFNYLNKDGLNGINKALSILRTKGFRSYDTSTCGIHIHISKDAISHLTLYKMLKLFYENANYILKISQRKIENFNKWSTLTDKEESITYKAKNKKNNLRYTAINLTNNKTIEFRIFRGTLKTESFYKNIEFIQAVIDFSKCTSIGNITVSNFNYFVSNNRKVYPNLFNFIIEKEVM